jgi:DNA-directed RNA polymerase specialized sigma24 family protein
MEHGDMVDRSMAELDAVHRLASYLSTDDRVVDDLVQTTFQRAFAAAAGEPNLAAHDLRPWLFKLLVELSKARLGDPFTPPTPLERAAAEPSTGVAGQTPCCHDLSTFEWDGASDRLAEAVRELPLAYRTVFLLWSVERLGNGQIAKVLGLSDAVVRGRLYRARMIVSTQLGESAIQWGMGVSEPLDA